MSRPFLSLRTHHTLETDRMTASRDRKKIKRQTHIHKTLMGTERLVVCNIVLDEFVERDSSISVNVDDCKDG